MELLHRAEGDVMTMLAEMNEELVDEDIMEELMRCFSYAPTTIQVIEKLGGRKQRPGKMPDCMLVDMKSSTLDQII